MKNKYIMTIVFLGGIIILFFLGMNKWERKVGPQEVILNKQVCHFCGMHIGGIRFAGQIQTESETLFYDDMGCLINDLMNMENETIKKSVTAIYYHHYFEDRWISEDEVVFIKVEESPMGHNLAAITRYDPESVAPLNERMSLSQARIQVLKP